MKRASAIPFLAMVLLCFVALFAKGWGEPGPKGGESNPGDVAWMLTASGLVLLMTPGLSFFYGGMVSFKNVVSTMLQSLIALGIISLVWVVVGFSLAFGDDIGGVIGNPLTFLMFDGVGEATHAKLSPSIPLLVFAMFQLKFAIITPALITGSFAERVRFSAYLLFMVLFSLFIYAPLAHWTWHPRRDLLQVGREGLRGRHGGAHVGRVCGAGGRDVSGPAAEPSWPMRRHEPANVPFVILGTGMLWFGWFGFNAGSAMGASGTAALAFATTNTASAAAMLSWIFFDWMKGNKPSALGACIGAVVGLVAITPAAGFRHDPRVDRHRRGRQRRQQPGRPLEDPLDARRHARRFPLPRRRRHDRHGDDRHLRQGRRLDLGTLPDLPVSPAGARDRRRLRVRGLVASLQDHRLDHSAARDRPTRRTRVWT